MTAADGMTADFLADIPIFSGCSREELSVIASSLEPVQMGVGEIVCRQGDPGQEMYIIASGQVRVVSDAETEKVVFAHLGPGEFFGEMALVTGAPRSAAIIATTDARLWRLKKSSFDPYPGGASRRERRDRPRSGREGEPGQRPALPE